MTISLRNATRFWSKVEQCLTQIYGLSDSDAARRTLRMFEASGRTEAGPTANDEWLTELVYHEEPISLAARLAGEDIPADAETKETYERIMAESSPLKRYEMTQDQHRQSSGLKHASDEGRILWYVGVEAAVPGAYWSKQRQTSTMQSLEHSLEHALAEVRTLMSGSDPAATGGQTGATGSGARRVGK